MTQRIGGLEVPFVKARNFTDTGEDGRNIDLLVMHFMVSPEDSDRAESCARMFATTTREASAHYMVDDNSIVQGVRDEDVAWAAPGINFDGIQVEQAGTTQSADQWRDRYSSNMLELVAELNADKCRQHELPAIWLSVADLHADRRGITDHWAGTKAFRLSTHTDCQVHYPRRMLIDMTQHRLDKDHNKEARPTKPDLPAIELNDVSFLVKKAQKLLSAHGYLHREPFDTHFDARMERAVRRFQHDEGLRVDGVVGPFTWRALRRVP